MARRRRWKPAIPDITRRPPPEDEKFRPGHRAMWRGRPVIVVARVPGTDDTYKVTEKLDDPHDQRYWADARGALLVVDSAVDKLANLALNEHGELDDEQR